MMRAEGYRAWYLWYAMWRVRERGEAPIHEQKRIVVGSVSDGLWIGGGVKSEITELIFVNSRFEIEGTGGEDMFDVLLNRKVSCLLWRLM